ncbi:gp30 DNA ligase [Delftia phage PhiW-14]|uniref:DNA ligase n=1 Tax=Delftia phage PhiW-14 TaxID=665032 RepID=C9DGH2_BPW14|nr:gp30 DNA ligase [Delftia phage PhiW-14]ACV50223.1 gp30 DNA ligase [Delftia phage PhiW-14]
MNILQHIEHLRSLTGTKDKKAYLATLKDNPNFLSFVHLTLEPLTNMYMTELPDGVGVPGHTNEFNEDEFIVDLTELVGKLTNRTLSKRLEVANAIQGFINKHANVTSWDLLDLVVRRTLSAGLAEKSINDVFGEHFLTLVPYQRCVLPKDSNIRKWTMKDGRWETVKLSQIKADGEYANVTLGSEGLKVQTRNGRLFPVRSADGQIIQAWAGLNADMVARYNDMKGMQLHGELMIEGPDGKLMSRAEGNGVFNSLLKQGSEIPEGHRVVMHVWDAIPLENAVSKGRYDMPYIERFGFVNRVFAGGKTITPIETRMVWTVGEALDHLREALARGLEGTVLKASNAIWRDGDNPDQIKFKIEFTVDLILTAFKAGDANGKNASTFGSMELESSDGLLKVSATGISDKDRAELHKNKAKYIGGVFKVTANDIMAPSRDNDKHSLFLPRVNIKTFRVDKAEADDLPSIIAQLEAAKANYTI